MPSVTLGKKRPNDAIVQNGVKPKRVKFGDDGEAKTVALAPAISAPDEIDFPRGGGSSFTPLEQRAIRAEALKEADEEIFKEEQSRDVKQARKRLRNGQVKESSKKTSKTSGESLPRIEHLNYKRVAVGMRILGQVIEIHPLHVIISLPNQMLGHIPLPQVTHQLSERIERLPDEGDSDDEEEESEEEEESPEAAAKRIPELQDIFRAKQYVQTIVTAIHAAGATAPNADLGKPRSETDRGSRRVVLSTVPKEVNKEISGKDLVAGYVIAGAVKSVEDHGYVLDFGVNDVSGFLSFKDAKKGPWGKKSLSIGYLLQTCVRSMSSNGKVCTVTIEESHISAAKMSQLTSVESVLPALRVRALVTGVQPGGLNVQVHGYFAGTIDLTHLGKVDTSSHKAGEKVDARILWDIPETNPRQIALSVLPHVVNLAPSKVRGDEEPLEDTYPIGTILEGLKVVRVEADRGVVVAIGDKPIGFVHISNVSDEHVPTLSPSSGLWKIGTVHRGRIIGHSPLDALLHLSFKQSVLDEKFFKVTDVQVGQIVKGTVRSLTGSAVFVAISGNMHAVVWPNHFADIRLKHPERKFKVGSSIKCRVLVVDPEKNRICLTAKKTLLESQLPVISSIAEAKVGVLAHAVVYKVSERVLSVEFFNNVKGIIPLREATDTNPHSLEGAFAVGQPVKLRILEVDYKTSRIIGSIVQATKPSPAVEISKLEIGHTVTGPVTVTDIHQDNVVLEFQPKDSATKLKALLSLANLANHRRTTVQQGRTSLSVGQEIKEPLVLVSKNVEKALLIVAVKPQARAKVPNGQTSAGGGSLKFGDVKVGMTVPGLVIRHHSKGSTIRLSKHVFATLYSTDVCDNFETGNPFPALESVISVTILEVDESDQKVVVSARLSKVNPVQAVPVVDREVSSLDDLTVGDEIRGFVKTIADHGVFVSIGRGIDARIQIKELFDEFVKDWRPRFQVQQVVKGRILSTNREKGQVEMTLRSGDLKTLTGTMTLSDFTPGQKVDGVIKKIEEYGVFVEIKGTKISGLCHKSELVDANGPSVAETLKLLKPDDSVRAVVLKVDSEKRRISFGLKPSYFFSDDLAIPDENEDYDADPAESEGEEAQEDEDMASNAESSGDERAVIDLRIPGDSDQGEGEEDNPPSPDAKGHPAVPLSLKLPRGLRWTSTEDQDDAMDTQSESESGGSDNDQPAKKKKRRHEIEYDLTADLHNRTPQSSADFERLLLSSPNSSFLWIRFMSFQLQLSEIEKARETGRRALQTINFREEQERLNVWIALINLENSYGTEQTLDVVFREAARANDSKTIYLRLASILEDTQKIEAAEEQYRKTCKKFSKSSKVWSLFGEFCMKHGKIDEARQLLQRSLLSIEKRKHLKTISKFAQMEYKLGDPERGRTIFEGIVDTHRKRLDLWNIYIDMEAGQQNLHAIRGILERALSLKVSKKKAKFLFKKWLELEKRMGDEAGIENVKDKAIEWTRNAAKGRLEQEQV